jgi:pilus assembly protein CpaE
MLILSASQNDSVARALHEFFQQRGEHDLQPAPLDQIVVRAAQSRPDCVILVTSENGETTLQVLREVLEVLPVRVLVVGPSSDAKMILRVMREGAYQYIDQAELDVELDAALKRLRSESPLADESGRTIAVLGVIGGCGASMLAANIATAYAQRQKTCCLLDLRLHSGDLAPLLDLQPKHSVADFCAHIDRMDATMFTQCFANHPSGLKLLGAPASYKDATRVTPRGIRKLLFMARSSFRYVVMDIDRNYRTEQSQALVQSDVILLVLRPDVPSLRQAQRVLDYFGELNIPTDRLHVAVNRFARRRDVSLKDVERALGLGSAQVVPEDPKRIERSINRGKPVVTQWPRADVSQRIVNLAESVNGRMS